MIDKKLENILKNLPSAFTGPNPAMEKDLIEDELKNIILHKIGDSRNPNKVDLDEIKNAEFDERKD